MLFYRQIFEVYETMPNASLGKMNSSVKSATNICTIVYIFVGFFGYVAFCDKEFSGNILLNLTPSFTSDVIKVGFVISVAFSFPLVIFPCRASLYSLLYRRVSYFLFINLHLNVINYEIFYFFRIAQMLIHTFQKQRLKL